MRFFRKNKALIIFVCVLIMVALINVIEAKSNEEIYQEKLDQLKPDDVEGHYKLGLWCKQNKLPEQAKIQFTKVLELDPKHEKARQELESIIQAEKDAKIAGAIKKYGNYKGVLEKPGADNENLPWDKAREKETDHFIVKTNLSIDALNDICWIMEYSYFFWQGLWGLTESGEKSEVIVAKNREEYEKIHMDLLDVKPGQGEQGVSISKGYNKNQRNILISYYFPKKSGSATYNTLIHEGTHNALNLLGNAFKLSVFDPPKWVNEGLATYFECCEVKEKKLVNNLINQRLLPVAKLIINRDCYLKLRDFINLSRVEYEKNYTFNHPEAWSLVYFLLNGKYRQGFRAYFKAWQENKIDLAVNREQGLCVQDKDGHINLFEQCMGVPIDQLENEWKEYVLSLKGNPRITLELKDKPIENVIEAIALLGDLKVTVDKDVQGLVSVNAKDELAIEVLEKLVKAKGFTLVKEKDGSFRVTKQ